MRGSSAERNTGNSLKVEYQLKANKSRADDGWPTGRPCPLPFLGLTASERHLWLWSDPLFDVTSVSSQGGEDTYVLCILHRKKNSGSQRLSQTWISDLRPTQYTLVGVRASPGAEDVCCVRHKWTKAQLRLWGDGVLGHDQASSEETDFLFLFFSLFSSNPTLGPEGKSASIKAPSVPTNPGRAQARFGRRASLEW